MTKDDMEDARGLTRRTMLRRLGIATGIAYAAPVLMRLGDAHASGGSGGGSFSDSRPRRRRALRPEIVVTVPDAASVDLIAVQGYPLLARDSLALIGAQIARFTVPANRTLDQARSEILQLVPAALLDPNHLYRPSELPCSDDGCAAFDLVSWAPMSPSCPSGVVVGMIDTAVNGEHAALAGVEIEQFALAGTERRSSSRTHGTAIAVLLAGNARSRTPGLLPGARLVAADAFHADSAGKDVADAFDIARALDRLAASDAKVVNLSFAGPSNQVLERVVQAVLDRDVTLVAAAGNAGPNADPLFPAAYEGVVAVTAVDRHTRAWRQAAAGDHVDFAAPGVRLWTAASVSGGRFRSGTSYATPFVTAALGAMRARDPGATSIQAVERLAKAASDLGEPGRDGTYGWGLVQAPQTCAASSEGIFPAGSGN